MMESSLLKIVMINYYVVFQVFGDENITERINIKIGNIYTSFLIDGDATIIALELTSRELEESIDKRFNITLINKDSHCNYKLAPAMMFDMVVDGIDTLIGPMCDLEMRSVGEFAASLDIPVLGYAHSNEIFTDKATYSTFTRVTFTSQQFSQEAFTMIRYFGWKIVGLIAFDVYPCNGHLEIIPQIAKHEGIQVRKYGIWAPYNAEFANRTEIATALRAMKERSRVILSCLGFGFTWSRSYVLEAEAANMTGPEYVHILMYVDKQFDANPWQYGYSDDDLVKKLLSQVFVLLPEVFYTDSMEKWLRKIETIALSKYNKSAEVFMFRGVHLSTMHDALLLYGLAVHQCIELEGCNWKSGKDLFELFRNRDFIGVTGRVIMSDNADRLSDYFLESVNYEEGKWETKFKISINRHTYSNGTNGIERIVEKLHDFNWRTEGGQIPSDTPKCGYENEWCLPPEPDYTLEISISVFGIVFLTIAMIILIIKWRNNKFERELIQRAWLIKPEELIVKVNSHISLGSAMSLLSFGGAQHHDVHRNTGQYKGQKVEIQIYLAQSHSEAKREELLKLKELKHLTHDNLNPFIGMSYDKDHLRIVWNCCQKGSLEDLIFNEDIRLDHHFKVSIIRDVIKGLEYIHNSKVGCHGNLILQNCRVDSRWVVKLTGHGIDQVLHPHFQSGKLKWNNQLSNNDLIQIAPERLRTMDPEHGMTTGATQAADMYGFGMVLYQVLFREQPFTNNQMSVEEILVHVKSPLSVIVEPVLPMAKEEHHMDLIRVMPMCWKEKPEQRPNVGRIKHLISMGTRYNFSGSIVDHMINMMEKYAKNLEHMVEVKTKELIEERQRADALLNKMLPRSIAEKLKKGSSVEPEFFDSVTLMFADIVGFTTICSVSTPQQVVSMMNDFYSNFDATAELFDVYKVETIGDAYMVASGLPIRNGTKHVTEISDLALKYTELIKEQRVPHLPNQNFQVRIGIHTGPVAAGVVGLSMPHYCLFGDTVNMASRMESNGIPMKIQVSLSTKLMLEQTDKYELIARGTIEVKGKGQQETFWLSAKIKK